MKITCPNDPAHDRFSSTAHVVEEWLVDRAGHFVAVLTPALEVSHRPDSDDLFICLTCGARANAER